RLPDRLHAVHSLRDHRPAGSQRADVAGHDDGLADADLAAVQADAVRTRRRLGAAGRHAGGQLRRGRVTPDTAMTLARAARWTMGPLASVPLLTALAAGLLVGVLQAATQINEMTLSFIPKILAVAAAFAIAGPWMLRLLLDFTRQLFFSVPGIIG